MNQITPRSSTPESLPPTLKPNFFHGSAMPHCSSLRDGSCHLPSSPRSDASALRGQIWPPGGGTAGGGTAAGGAWSRPQSQEPRWPGAPKDWKEGARRWRLHPEGRGALRLDSLGPRPKAGQTGGDGAHLAPTRRCLNMFNPNLACKARISKVLNQKPVLSVNLVNHTEKLNSRIPVPRTEA